MKKQRNFFLLLFVSIIACSIVAQTPYADKQKARYFYLEGIIQSIEGNYDAAFDLYKYAHETDPENVDILSALGSSTFMIQADSIEHYKNALKMIRPSIDAYPNDDIEAKYYAYLSAQVGDYNEAIRIYSRIDTLFPDKSEILLLLADMYSYKKDFKKSLEYYRRYETAEGKSSQISLRKIVYHLNLGDTISAINEADSLIAYNPKEAGYHILKGDVFIYLGMNDSALTSYKRAEIIDPQRGEAKLALASFYKNQNDSIAYDNKIYEALLCDDFNLEDKMSLLAEYLATLLQDKSSTERGDYLFSVLRDQYPHEAQVLDLAARYSAAKGNWKEAVEEISYAIDVNPQNKDYWHQSMSYQIADDQYEEAIKTYNRSKIFIGYSKDMTYLLGSAYLLNKDYDNTIATYSDMIHQINPTLSITDSITDKKLRNTFSYEELLELSNLYAIIGDAYYQSDNIDKAFMSYENSLFFYNENAMTLNNYAYFLSEKGGDLDKAEAMSEKAIKAEPDNPTYLDTYAWIAFKKRDYPKAKTYQESAVEKSGDDVSSELFEHLGDILFMNGDPKGALENWEKALKLEPDKEILQRKVKHKTYFFE